MPPVNAQASVLFKPVSSLLKHANYVRMGESSKF